MHKGSNRVAISYDSNTEEVISFVCEIYEALVDYSYEGIAANQTNITDKPVHQDLIQQLEKINFFIALLTPKSSREIINQVKVAEALHLQNQEGKNKNPEIIPILIDCQFNSLNDELKSCINHIYENWNLANSHIKLNKILAQIENSSKVEIEPKSWHFLTATKKTSFEQDIYEGLRNGEFCYVLSYTEDTKKQLLDNIVSKFKNDSNPLDYSIIDYVKLYENKNTPRKPESYDSMHRGHWYENLAKIIHKDIFTEENCNIDLEINQFWTEQRDKYKEKYQVDYNELFNRNIFLKYIEKLLKEFSSRKQGSIIIVFNEIEKIFKNLEFKEELFELILQIYKQRQNRDIFKKINFLFVGSDNYILQKISIGWIVDFSQKEGEVTINKIECDNRLNKIDLNKIIIKVWKLSDGNPYLTQELFQYILTDTINIVRGREIEYVNNLLERIR